MKKVSPSPIEVEGGYDDDADLVQSILAGNVDDFRKLVGKYQHDAERWAFQHVKNLSDAEDIAQEAFVEAYFRLDTLRELDKFGSWLRSIVSNISVSWLRRRKPAVSFEEISIIHSHGKLFERYNRYEVSTPDDLLEQQEREKMLQAAISALPPTYRRIITMFYFDSRSYKEIAAHLDISEASKCRIFSRGLAIDETSSNGNCFSLRICRCRLEIR
ncbi:MAG: RNA polymerase sigma factor [Candidatus Poribacteria bacterium]